MTKSYFNQDIKPVILEELQKAKSKISVVIAWFNDSDIFNILLEKAQSSDIEIKIIMSEDDKDDRINSILNFRELLKANDHIYIFKIPKDVVMVHDKYCVIDENVLISGSYNWTFGAQHHNTEHVLLITDNKVCNDFLNDFQNIFEKYCLPIIESSSKKLEELFSLINHNIQHGNIRLAMNIDDVITGIRKKYLGLDNDSDEKEIKVFDKDVYPDADQAIIFEWWENLDEKWRSFFLQDILQIKYYSPEITSLRNLLSAITNLDLTKYKGQMDANFKGIRNLTFMKKIVASRKAMSSFSGLENFDNLIFLEMRQNLLKSVSSLPSLPKLSTLDLSGNQIDTIYDLPELPELTELIIFKNPLTTLKGIEKLKKLKTVKIDDRFRQFENELNIVKELGLTTVIFDRVENFSGVDVKVVMLWRP